MPITVPNTTSGYGNMSQDVAGNLLFTPPVSPAGVLYTVSRSNGQLSIIATNVGAAQGGPFPLTSSVYDPTAGLIYVGADTSPMRIYSVNPVDGNSSLLFDLGPVGGTLTALLIAPAGFGSVGGQLIICTYNGSGVLAVDLSNPAPCIVVATGDFNSGTFAPDGTLYCTDHTQVVTVSATGTVTPFAVVPRAEGLVSNSSGNTLFVASAFTDSVYTVSLPGAVVARYAAARLSGGWFPTGMAFDNGKLLVGVRNTSAPFYVIDEVTP